MFGAVQIALFLTIFTDVIIYAPATSEKPIGVNSTSPAIEDVEPRNPSRHRQRHRHGEMMSKHANRSEWVLDALLGGKSKVGVFTADFLDENGTTVSVRDGHSTILNCNVYLRHDKTVSWLRHKDDTIELLTVGDSTYTGDPRINVSFQYPNNWRLNISDIVKSDSGVYLCQISTFPPKALFVNLKVEDALVEMVGGDGKSNAGGTHYYNPGSEIELACVVRNRSHWSTDVVWLKDNVPLDIFNKASISIGSQVNAEDVLSRLWIGGASRQDSGNYTCHLPGHNASDFPRAKVKVLVVDGDFHAAVYSGHSKSIHPSLTRIFHEQLLELCIIAISLLKTTKLYAAY